MNDLGQVLDLALGAPDLPTLQGEILDFLDAKVGHAGAFFIAFPDRRSPPAVGLSGLGQAHLERLGTRHTGYEAEIAPVRQAARRGGGVAVDSQVLGSALWKTRYYADLVQPLGGGHSLLSYLERGGELLGLLVLGRELGRGFRSRDLERMRRLQPALSLAVAASTQQIASGAAHAQLTRREREIGELLCLGYTNREIGLASGTSPHTVRNQLAKLFDKLEVTTRAELVARWLGR